ncbi:MAG: hypothetical protein NTV86_17970 [Planctomycetota bacterium]|nr:hypothetical protein [Planctomycetota bacterium]
MTRRLVLAAAFVSALGCLGGCEPSRAGFEQVYTGMLQEQVYHVLGAPKAYDAKEWVYEPGIFNPRVVIDFVDGRVSRKSWGELAPAAPESQPAAPSTQPAQTPATGSPGDSAPRTK